jgi:hypothetical protein
VRPLVTGRGEGIGGNMGFVHSEEKRNGKRQRSPEGNGCSTTAVAIDA